MKNVVLIVLFIIVVVLLVLAVGFYNKAEKYVKNYESEKYDRMVAEESLQKHAAKLVTLESQLKSANNKMERIQTSIDQEKSINGDLQKQYDELAMIKADLEDKLKSTIAQSQPVETNATIEAAK